MGLRPELSDLPSLMVSVWHSQASASKHSCSLLETQAFCSPLVLIWFPHSQGMDKNITELNVMIGNSPQAPKVQAEGHSGARRPESLF